MDSNAYIYSQRSIDSVRSLIAEHYALAQPDSCHFYARGLHDNYLISTNNDKYILRIYRNNWRSSEEIGFELDLLSFLGDKGAPVSFPLRTKSGELKFEIDSPEGTRSAALFAYANGHAPGNDISTEDSVLLGKTVANIHQLTVNFKTKFCRPILDAPYLLDESVITIEPFIGKDELAYIKSLQRKFHQSFLQLSKDHEKYGICIGDVNPTNFHIHEHQPTLFDFDQCGYGYRAFEIGKFISSVHNLTNKNDIASAFIAGYQQVRQLDLDEIAAIPYFELLSVIWVMAINAGNAELIGHKWLEAPFWTRKFTILKQLDAQIFNK